MSLQLIDHSQDLRRLRNDGYEIEMKGGYLCIHHIPYVSDARVVAYGMLVTNLDLQGTVQTVQPRSHVIYFQGGFPCNTDGTPIDQIRHSSRDHNLNGIIVNHSFSNKPNGGYIDYYHKISQYVDIISAPARSLDSSVTAKTFKVVASEDDGSVFHYCDTNSSRANIDRINAKLKNQKIAIIGLGGTGAYILDKVAKSPVAEIHLYDGDDFLLHNAFRSPGASSIEELNSKKRKTDHYKSVYGKMHKYIYSHPCYVNEANISELDTMSFVFISIDRDSVKKLIIEHLLTKEIPFIDVGLGVNVVDDSLIGTIRVTTSSSKKNDHLYDRISCGDDKNNAYSENIQISELNSMNADWAVLKWKKMLGFYQDLKEEHNTSFCINVSQLRNDDYRA